MKPESQAKSPLHLRLTTADWVECFTQLTRAELGVFCYIRTRDPYGDHSLEIDCSQVGQLLGLHRTIDTPRAEAAGILKSSTSELLTAKSMRLY